MYAQIAERIEHDLVSGRFKTGDFLPSEVVLSKELGISRATITKAYQLLENRRLVVKIQGSGTQIAQAPMERSIIEFTGFTQHVKQLGRSPGSRLLSIREGVGGADSDVEAAYETGMPLLVVERMRLVDGQPQGIQIVALPQSITKRAGINEESLSSRNASLYEQLAKFGIILDSAEETLVAAIATDRECKTMNLSKHTPMIEVFRKSFDQEGQMVEAVRARYLGSAYVYKVRLGTKHRLAEMKMEGI